MPLIRPNHLEQLAEQTAGRDRLGELVRNLIYCWVPERVLGMSFLAGDVNNFPDWDGWARLAPAGKDSAEHRTVWQITVERSAVNKIRRDFKKSFEASLPPGWNRSTTTYVALTPRKLKKPGDLEGELRKAKENDWYDVRVIDAVGLEQWIDKCPAVEAWAGEQFGIGAGRFGESLSRHWTRWAETSAPEISGDLVLAGRDVNVVKDGLRFESDRILPIQTDSPEESVALVHAVINTLPQETRERLLANALVITNETKAAEYVQQPRRQESKPLTILVPPAVSYANPLARAGDGVVMAFGRKDPNARSVIVKRSLRSDFEKALISSMNIPAADATAQARACGCSVSIWRVWNLLHTAAPGDQKPIWARDDGVASRLVPITLLRSWDEICEGDRIIVADLSGQKYEDYRDSLQPYGTCDDPLFERVGSVFNVVAPAVAFTLLGRLITPSHLVALERIAKTVFGEIERDVSATWDLAPDDTPRLSERPKYSTWLRDGLAETLLCIAFLGETQPFGVLAEVGGGQDFVNRLVRALPGLGTDPRVLASLRDQLPYLAEAAPVPFVEALESLLQGDSTRLTPLFRDRGFFGAAYHAGLLWALEGLAWSPEFLPRVTLILGALDELDPGGNVGNRPRHTLRDIFLAWHRGTSASIDGRIAALKLLHDRHPETAWWLSLKLMPRPHDTATPTHEPTWRDFGRSEMPDLTNRVVAEGYRKYAELALDLAQGNLSRQMDLIEVYPQFPPEYRKRVLDMLTESSSKEYPEDLRVEVWTALHEIVTRHRAFRDAGWAMDVKDLRKLEDLAAKYIPRDPIRFYKWILDDQWPETGYKAGDLEGKQRDIDKRRRDALLDILNRMGWDGIHRAIRDYQYPHISAIALAEMLDEQTLLTALDAWAQERSPNQLSAIRAATWARYRHAGDSWNGVLMAHLMSSGWAAAAKANALIDYPAALETFRLIASLGADVENYYWEHCQLYLDGAEAEAKRYVAESYICHGRAPDLLGVIGRRFDDLGVDLVLRIVDETLKRLNEGRLPSDRSMFGYHLNRAFTWLRKQPGVNPPDIARLEYPFLPLLIGAGRGEREELVLHRLLAQDPSFFVQVLCDVYKPANRPREQPADATAESRAMAGWRLLGSWRLVPGVKEDTSIDKAFLVEWIEKARSLAAEKDRADVADQHIGKVLYHASADPTNKAWPPLPVLDLIEILNAKHIGRGFALECVNARGVTSRAPLDGGKLERELENAWRARARALNSRWPRVRALFDAIADDWKGQAKWHDEDADKMRMRWS